MKSLNYWLVREVSNLYPPKFQGDTKTEPSVTGFVSGLSDGSRFKMY